LVGKFRLKLARPRVRISNPGLYLNKDPIKNILKGTVSSALKWMILTVIRIDLKI